jgi:hypothetical protein
MLSKLAVMLITVILGIISYSFCNFSIVLMLGESKPWIKGLMEWIKVGDENRGVMALIIVIFSLVFGLVQLKLLKLNKDEVKGWLRPALVVSLICALSYPIFSKDIFTYLFSARMVTEYQVNPYEVAPNQFLGKELWIDFMDNIHNKYVYGPVYLGYSLIPAVLFGSGRMLLVFGGMKLLNWLIFIAGGWALFKLEGNKKLVLAYWFFNPFLLMELLVNAHNDLLMVVSMIISLSLWRSKKWLAAGWWLMSAATKFVSGALAPLAFIPKRYWKLAASFMLFGLWGYLILIERSNVWYFSWIYMLIPLAKIRKRRLWQLIFFWQLTLIWRYIPFVVNKHWVIIPWIDEAVRFYLVLPLAFLAVQLDWKKIIRPQAMKTREIA